jgi:Family of unknown function (DUF5682)/VWA domain containing CoxE-like protein
MSSAAEPGGAGAGHADPAPPPATSQPMSQPVSAVEALAAATDPFLIGIRHHSPALAAALPALLDAYRPEVLLIELPTEAGPWLSWLADPQTQAPVALAGPVDGGASVAFYPFADFSPELAALRWARERGVEVVPCDLPLADRSGDERQPAVVPGEGPAGPDAGARPAVDSDSGPDSGADFGAALRRTVTGRAGEDLWDRQVEARAPGATPEQIRRAGLAVGWALRQDAGSGVSRHDLAREAWMRGTLRTVEGRRCAMLLGAFHIPAILDPAVAAKIATADQIKVEHERVLVQAEAQAAKLAAARPGAMPARAATSAAAAPGGPARTKAYSTAMSLVTYTFALLDERSGYPAGIRDPHWQQSVYESQGDPAAVEAAAAAHLVEVCRALRAAGHPAGPAEARQALRFALDLAVLRDLPAPARGELVEAVTAVLGHGELLGRGRAVAGALEHAMVGRRRGRLAPGTPQSGLRAHAQEVLAGLRLPGPGDKRAELRLDPLRSPLDRRREVALNRLAVCAVPYGETSDQVAPGGLATLTTKWRVCWTPSTEAHLDLLTVNGVTLAQAAAGVLRRIQRQEQADGGPTVAQTLAGLLAAAECGLPELAGTRLREIATVVLPTGNLSELLGAAELLDRLRAGHVPGLPDPAVLFGDVARAAASAGAVPAGSEDGPETAAADSLDDKADQTGSEEYPAGALHPGGLDLAERIDAAALVRVAGLAGSQDLADARALTAFAVRCAAAGSQLRADSALRHLEREGAPMISAAAGACRVVLGSAPAGELGTRLAGWIDTATHRAARSALRDRLTGLLAAAGPLLGTGPAVLDPLVQRVNTLPDGEFLDRLPALRGGFSQTTPADRDRILRQVEDGIGAGVGADVAVDGLDPELLADAAWADAAGRAALELAGFRSALAESAVSSEAVAAGTAITDGSGSRILTNGPAAEESGAVSTGGLSLNVLVPADRWRLILARRQDECTSPARRYAQALDELYGRGEGGGEGADQGRGRSASGGREAGYPSVREWSADLEVLFGKGIREEVLAAAAGAGRLDAALALDPAGVRPSVELLRNVLALAGGLPESALAKLRPLVARLVSELAAQLANRLRPALTGLTSPLPTRRPGGRLDFDRTVRANLATARRGADGSVRLLPERPVFHSRVRRQSDWRLILVVDVSGSMESSVIWSALTAAVFAGVSAVSTHFLAFSTAVADFTDQIADPLSLLLEVRVGGGTHIAAGLAAARELVTVPSKTLIVTISDFEEGYPLAGLLGEVRRLAESGVTLLGCASLDDNGTPRYSIPIAQAVAGAGMPVAALSPLELAGWVGERIR